MTQTITISRTTGTRALMAAFIVVIVLLATRAAKNAMAGFKTAHRWLHAQHVFFGDDGDPIKCTGWQFVGYNIIAVAVAMLLCIKY